MIVKPEDGIARAIVRACQQNTVQRANAALPQFRLDNDLPATMIELLVRLDQRS